MATGVAQMVVQCVFEGSTSLNDMEKGRRPYHKYCGCALHTMKSSICSNACPKQTCISFPKKSWPECSLSKTASLFPSHSSLPKTKQCHSDKQQGCHHRGDLLTES